jgi:uncharacterized protein involved in exopolysaccharide biosynthesis
MGTRLEQFIDDNRDQFDSDEPGEQVWKKLAEKIPNAKKQQPKGSRVIMLKILRWSAAAAILVLAGLGVYSLFNNRTTPPAHDTAQQTVRHDEPATESDPIFKEINPTYAKEVYHFTQLIELKQNELKEIEKEHPNLYKKFTSDIDKLDSSYNALKKELPVNPNREQLLEAMIENLRLQTEILNQQLSIINEIKASKNNNHERTSKKA